MNSADSHSSPPSPTPSVPPAAPKARSPLVVYLAAAALAGLLAGGTIARVNTWFGLPTGTVPAETNMAMMGDAKKAAEVRGMIAAAEYKNTILSSAWIGLVFAGALGAAAGIKIGSSRAIFSGGAMGAVTGAALGAGAGALLQWVLAAVSTDASLAMYRVLAAHALIFAAAGIASGAASAAAAGHGRNLLRDAATGAIGGLLAAVLFLPLSVLLTFVVVGSQDRPIPEGIVTQVSWTILGALAIAVLLAKATAGVKPSPSAGN